uniref:Uncharacterized protein n=1 Tax=Romanomermis culicivorax TaxID=13658 RepID=A0A915K5N5_ROMCU
MSLGAQKDLHAKHPAYTGKFFSRVDCISWTKNREKRFRPTMQLLSRDEKRNGGSIPEEKREEKFEVQRIVRNIIY